MTDRIARAREMQLSADEKGAALPFVAIMLMLLIGMAAFAVDLGWLYLQGARIQRGADAASLAGVVHLPANTAQVNAQTANGANANGWHVGEINGIPVPVNPGPDELNWIPVNDNRLQVSLTASVPTFFIKIFGIHEVEMTRTATAEYVKPVPMGSPSACFGIAAFASDLTGPQSLANQGLGDCAAWTMNFWAAINGPLTAKEHGDPFSTRCIQANSGGCNPAGNTNPQYRAHGYFYGLEIPGGKTSFDVKIFDAGFYHRTPTFSEAGDTRCLTNSNCDSGPTTVYSVWGPDTTPLDPQDNTLNPALHICTETFGPESGTPNTRNQWRTICTIPNPTAGIYVLQVRTTGNGGGMNAYSIGITTTPSAAPLARTYAINDMSIFTNSGGAPQATVYLAEVETIHSGKNLQLDFFDPGENTGNAWVEVRTPTDDPSSCRWTSRNEAGTVTGGPANINPCRLQSTIASVAQFNAQWLNMSIQVPPVYACGATCYWTMRLELGTVSHDRTTWAARIIGNPVRLVPNQP